MKERIDQNTNLSEQQETLEHVRVEIGEWMSTVEIPYGEAIKNDGKRGHEGVRKVTSHSAGLIVQLDQNHTLRVPSLDKNELITKFKDRVGHDLTAEEVEALEKKIPQTAPVEKPFVVEHLKDAGQGLLSENRQANLEIDDQLRGLKVGVSLFKNKDFEKELYSYNANHVIESEWRKIISVDDAKKRNIPGQEYEGTIEALFPEKIEMFDEIKNKVIESIEDEKSGEKTFEAEIALHQERDLNNGYKYVSYLIKSVPTAAIEYETVENLNTKETTRQLIGKTIVLEDKYTSDYLRENEEPLPNGKYLIEYRIPTSGNNRGLGKYHIITEKILEERKKLHAEEAADPYQVELLKTAVRMDTLVSQNKNESMYAVKEADSLWHAYSGEPGHLWPLKGFKSKSTGSSVQELIQIFKEAGYRESN